MSTVAAVFVAACALVQLVLCIGIVHYSRRTQRAAWRASASVERMQRLLELEAGRKE